MKPQLQLDKISNAASSFNFEIKKYYQNKPKFNSVYSKNKFSKIKEGTYVINLDKFKSIGTHWITLYVNGNSIIFFDSSRVRYIPKEIIKKLIENKNIITNIYRIQAQDLIMRWRFWTRFINFMLKGRTLLY